MALSAITVTHITSPPARPIAPKTGVRDGTENLCSTIRGKLLRATRCSLNRCSKTSRSTACAAST